MWETESNKDQIGISCNKKIQNENYILTTLCKVLNKNYEFPSGLLKFKMD